MSHIHPTLILSSADIRAIVDHFGVDLLMDQLIDRLELAFRHFDPEQTVIPVRAGFHYEHPEQGLVEWMPLLDKGKQVMVKMVGYHPKNPAKYGLPTILSTIAMYSTTTGHLQALMDGVFLTAFRTGAASAVASKYLAKGNSAVLGLIGCGCQAVTQLHALSRVFELNEVYYYDINEQTQSSFPERCRSLGLRVEFIPSNIEELLPQVDILCTATSIDIGAGPLFGQVTTLPHLHINAVGSDFPGKVEIPKEWLSESFVCPDFLAQALQEGECQQLSPEQISPDIITVAKEPERFEQVKRTHSVFDSTGLALEDQVAMELFMDCAAQLGLGNPIAIENLSPDAKNPYHFLPVPTAKLIMD